MTKPFWKLGFMLPISLAFFKNEEAFETKEKLIKIFDDASNSEE